MIATHDAALLIAKQVARGIYPSQPEIFLQLMDGGLVSNPTITDLNVMDGRIFGGSAKRVSYVESGGQPVVSGQPKALAAIIAYMMGNDVVTAGPAPQSTHVTVDSLDLNSSPFLTCWQKFGGQWTLFRDCQIVGGTIEAGVDNPWMRVTPNIIGLAKEMYVAKPTIPAGEDLNYHWLDASGWHSLAGDWDNMAHITAPTDQATLLAALISFKTLWNDHLATAGTVHHKVADTTNVLAYTDPTDLATAITALTAIRTALGAHYADTTVHRYDDSANGPSTAWLEPVVTLADALIAAQDLLGNADSPGAYNRHLGARACIRSVTVTVDLGATVVQGEGITACSIHRKPGTIGVSVDGYQQDMRLINIAKFGTPNPQPGDELVVNPVKMGFVTKFVASLPGEPEQSSKIEVPEFDLDPTPLMGLTGSAAGDEPIVAVGGEATGDAPIVTFTSVNAKATSFI